MLYLLRKGIRQIPGVVIKTVPLPQPEVVTKSGARAQIGRLCRKNGFERVLLVTDKTIFSLGLHEKILVSLKESGIFCSVFSDICSEPDLAVLDNGRKALIDSGADAIIALGGGAVMDACKMIAAGGKKKSRKSEALLRKFLFVRGKTLPLIAVPTTAGTGAEITVGAVVTDKRGRKGSTVIVGLDVRCVILDNELTLNAPRGITCGCGIDALSHGLEGVVASVRSTEEDKRKSMECVKLVLENLPALMNDPKNGTARQNMCIAAHYGGNAINKQLAGYVHAFAHTIGAKYHIPHGEAIALALLPVMETQKKQCMESLSALSRYCGLAEKRDSDLEACESLLCEIRRLIDLCAFDSWVTIPKEDFRSLARAVAMDSINYSPPVVMNDKQIFSVLDRINKERL